LTHACLIEPAVLAEIVACLPLAPLHNPANLAAILALAEIAPEVPQFASFDTAFHATNPQVALRYALPPELEADGLRRYGFHGLSYAAIVRKLPEMTGQALPRRLLALHLGMVPRPVRS
jgi:acetate kinase